MVSDSYTRAVFRTNTKQVVSDVEIILLTLTDIKSFWQPATTLRKMHSMADATLITGFSSQNPHLNVLLELFLLFPKVIGLSRHPLQVLHHTMVFKLILG